jgi:hypothetical protein
MTDAAPLSYLDRVNRSVAIVTPKEPYLRWARTVDPGRQYPGESVALLLPELADDAEAREFLRGACGDVFRELLAGWCEDQQTWPRSLDSWPLFTAWFELRFAGMAFDLDQDDLIHDSELDEELEEAGDPGAAPGGLHADDRQGGPVEDARDDAGR